MKMLKYTIDLCAAQKGHKRGELYTCIAFTILYKQNSIFIQNKFKFQKN